MIAINLKYSLHFPIRMVTLLFFFTSIFDQSIPVVIAKNNRHNNNKQTHLRSPNRDDLIRSGTMNELSKHGIKPSDINDLLFGNEGGEDASETERVAAATSIDTTTIKSPASTSPLSLSSSSSWLQDACKFVKDRNVVDMPAICRNRFPKYQSKTEITSEQRRRCHKLLWDCVVAVPSVPSEKNGSESVTLGKTQCTTKHQKCMAKSMSEKETEELFFGR